MVMNHRVDLVSAIMKHVDPTALDACKLVSPVFYRAVKEYLRTVTPEDAWEMLVKNAHHYASLNSGVAKMVLARHIFRVALPQDYPTFYVRSVYASGSGPIQLVGRIGVYFAKSGGGIIIYDDVAHKWPIRLPFKKLARAGGGLKIEYVSPSVRRVTLDTSRVTKTTPLEDIAADLRSQLPPQFGAPPDMYDAKGRYKIAYLSQVNERRARRHTQLELATTDHECLIQWDAGRDPILHDNRKKHFWTLTRARVVGVQLLASAK